MSLKISFARSAPARAGLTAVAVTTDQIDSEPHGVDWGVLRAKGFEAKTGQLEIVAGPNGPLALVGLGDTSELSAATFRQAAVAIARAASRRTTIAVDLLGAVGGLDEAEVIQALVEGLELGVYEYLRHKSEAKPSQLATVTIVAASGRRLASVATRGQAIAGGVNLARDLVNEPGGSMTPVEFAARASAVAKSHGLSVKVLDLAAIRKARLGGILGVNRGSEQEPRFVELTYKPAGKPKGHIALVGKGVTFDSGGLSIKPAQGMMTMKCDMAGAAAVLGAMVAVAQIGAKALVTGYMPLTDNMTGGDATRPGDVLTIRNGKTVEVLNTDAEGRLILADALSLACEAKPDAIVDLATLTGAAMAALGPQYAAVMGTNEGWTEQVLAAGRRASERLWQLPLPSEYRSMIDSTVADMKNIGGPLAGALTAGLFLKEFVAEGIAWAHVDIAGPAFTEAPFDEHPKGATGFGVRTLVELVTAFQPPS